MANNNKPPNKERKFSWYMKAPIRVLIRARDFYIQSMTECSGHFDYGTAMGCPTPQISTLPKSFSVNSTKSSNHNEDYKELVRAASTRSLGKKIEADLLRKQQVVRRSPATSNMPRSRSVSIGIIDEDKPCEFEEDIKVNTDVYPRSRSYAVTRRTRAF